MQNYINDTHVKYIRSNKTKICKLKNLKLLINNQRRGIFGAYSL